MLPQSATKAEIDSELMKVRREHVNARRARLIAEERDLYRSSLKLFVQAAWHKVLAPGRPLKWNWHLDVLCEMMQALDRGEVTRLIINYPPRATKSTIASICYPLWKWLRDPAHQFLCLSHGDRLAQRMAVHCRNIFRSAWFQERWGSEFQMAEDQDAKTRYETNKGGHRLSQGLASAVQGESADTIIIDDPHDARKVRSDSELQTVLDNYDDGVAMRLNDPATSAIVIIMQRLRDRDLTAHVLATAEKGEWTHLVFPQEYEPDHPFMNETTRRLDPRTKDGELFWPDRFPAAVVRKYKRKLTARGYAGQQQQRPTAQGGEILKADWWRPWDTKKDRIPEIEVLIHSWDTAFSGPDQKENARTAMVGLGVFWNERRNRYGIMLTRAVAGHFEYPELRKIARKLTDKDKPDTVLVEKKASGISLIQDLRRAGVPVVAYNPDRDKIARMYAVQAILESGQVYFPLGKRWAEEVIDECAAAPLGQYKDYPDALTQGLLRIRKMGLVEHPDDIDTDEDERGETNPDASSLDDDEHSAYG